MRKVCWFVWRIWRALVVPLGFRWRRLRRYAPGVRFGKGLVVKHDTYIGRGTIVLVHRNVRIWRDGMVAPYCHITDVNHGNRLGSRMRVQPLESRPVDIGPDVWLGAGCSVLAGGTIGQGCAVGGRAVVTRSLPDYAVAVGVPAHPIRFRRPDATTE